MDKLSLENPEIAARFVSAKQCASQELPLESPEIAMKFKAAKEAPADVRRKITALDAELSRTDLDISLRAAFIAERAELVAPTIADRARRALVENLPELYNAADVAAMSDDDAINEAVDAAVLEG